MSPIKTGCVVSQSFSFSYRLRSLDQTAARLYVLYRTKVEIALSRNWSLMTRIHPPKKQPPLLDRWPPFAPIVPSRLIGLLPTLLRLPKHRFRFRSPSYTTKSFQLVFFSIQTPNLSRDSLVSNDGFERSSFRAHAHLNFY